MCNVLCNIIACVWPFHIQHVFYGMCVVVCVARATILVTGSFLDAFQKVADMATGTRGKHTVTSDSRP